MISVIVVVVAVAIITWIRYFQESFVDPNEWEKTKEVEADHRVKSEKKTVIFPI